MNDKPVNSQAAEVSGHPSLGEGKGVGSLPFYSWMPKPLGILIFLILDMSPVFLGGMNLSLAPDIVGDLGWMTEDVQMAFFAIAIGLCAFPPLMLKYLTTHRLKQTLIAGLLLMTAGNLCIVTSHSVLLTCIVCLVMGCLRVMVLVCLTFAAGPYLLNVSVIDMFTKDLPPMSSDEKKEASHRKAVLMLITYIIILVYAYFSNWLFAWIAIEYSWRMAFAFVIGLQLFSLFLVIATMETEPVQPDQQMDWGMVLDTVLMMGILIPLTFVLLYGRTLDWLWSPRIVLCIGVTLVSAGLFLSRTLRSNYLNLRLFNYRNPLIATFLFMMAMVCNTPASIVPSFAQLITNINQEQWASLYLWAVLGIFVGFAIGMLLGMKRTHYRYVFALGFLLMCACHVYMYFQYQTEGFYENMRLPVVLTYAGLMLLYPLIASYGMNGLPTRHFVGFVFIMILMRNCFAPVLGVSLLTNKMQERQQYYNTRLVENVDGQNPNVQAIGGFNATTVPLLYMSKVRQSAIMAMRDISGLTIWITAGMTVICLLLPMRKEDRV